MKFPVLAPFVLFALVGCGGLGDQCAGGNVECVGEKGIVTVGFDAQTVEPGATANVTLTLTQTGYTAASYALTLPDGQASGTLSAAATDGPANGLRETYTAPSAPGIYRVVGTVVDARGKSHSASATVSVAVVP